MFFKARIDVELLDQGPDGRWVEDTISEGEIIEVISFEQESYPNVIIQYSSDPSAGRYWYNLDKQAILQIDVLTLFFDKMVEI